MGLEMELDFKKNNKLELSPNTVLPAPQHRSNIEKRYSRGNFNDLSRAKEGFSKISFHRYRSSSCKNIPSRSFGEEGDMDLKRGSIYQSSREVRKMKKMGSHEGRQMIELSRSSASSFSFRIVDSLCSIDEENPQKGTPMMSDDSNLNPTSVSKPYVEPCSADGFIEISLNLDNRENQYTEAVGSNSDKDATFSCHEVVSRQTDGNDLLERDTVLTLHKSHSAKVEMLYSPSPSDSDRSSRASSKLQFNPIRKMFDPFTKSKSLRSPLGHIVEAGDVVNMRRNRTLRKSLFHDFSHSRQNSDFDSQFVKKDQHQSVVASSPVHLHGCLKSLRKHGVPLFEFSLNSPGDTLVARAWKADNAHNWVYTFHSIDSKRKGNASGWGLNDIRKESSMVGQMQVSCYLCSELNDGDAFDDSLVTEYVLYDIAHARQCVSSQECLSSFPDIDNPPSGLNSHLPGATHELEAWPDAMKPKQQQKNAPDHGDFEPSKKPKPYPWASADLHPNLEIAAVVIQVPFEKRESLKYKRGDKICETAHSNLLNLPIVEQGKKNLPDNHGREKVKVIISSGNHGLPNTESQGPSSLLNRWRSGGGCDCGGWDMACPLVVFGNPCIHCAEDQPLLDRQQPLELFLQGTKENTPALSMAVVEEGQYAVDFHARLTTLQAFSVCVAILHGTEASTAAGQERGGIQLRQCNSLKVLIEEEAKFLIDAVTEEKKVAKKMGEIQSSYVINPPFSPIARV